MRHARSGRMRTRGLYISSFLFVALTLGAALAHAYSLPVKMTMARDEYFTAQQVYRGWALIGIAMAFALVSTVVLCFVLRNDGAAFRRALIAPIAIVASLVVFFAFTQPANSATHNWTVAHENWQQLRAQWEYSHAAGAALNLIAFLALLLSLLTLAGPRIDRS